MLGVLGVLGVLATALVAVASQATAGTAEVAGRSLQPPTVPPELPPRFSDDPFELDGVVIPPRDLIVPSLASANRDSAVFTHPNSFDVTRHAPESLAFGHGPHRCLGVELGKLESKVALRAPLSRYDDIRLAVAPDELVWRPGMFMRRVDTFPVVLRATANA